MESISQQYGIRLFWLYFKNKMIEGMEPAAGTKIKLDGTTATQRPELDRSNSKYKSARQTRVSTGKKHQSKSNRVVDFDVPTKTTTQPTIKVKSNKDVIPLDFPNDEFIKDSSSARQHIVEKGETLWSISKKYKVEVATLKALNDLSHNTLSVGQVIVLE